MSSFAERYLNGEFEQVWDELYALGAGVREQPYYDGAVAVARETMRRVRANCELLIERLPQLGWRFGYEWAERRGGVTAQEIAMQPPVLGMPTPPATLDDLEARYGRIPIALRAFYEIVGAINFVGTPFDRPNWPSVEDGLDPLYIAGVEQAFEGELREDAEYKGLPASLIPARIKPRVVEVEIAPDFLHKYFYSGVGSEYMALPAPGADAPLMFEDEPLQVEGRDLTLVRLLRYALAGGGFGAFQPDWVWQATEPDAPRPEDDLSFLTAGLWPI